MSPTGSHVPERWYYQTYLLFLCCLPVAAHPPLTSGSGQAAVRSNKWPVRPAENSGGPIIRERGVNNVGAFNIGDGLSIQLYPIPDFDVFSLRWDLKFTLHLTSQIVIIDHPLIRRRDISDENLNNNSLQHHRAEVCRYTEVLAVTPALCGLTQTSKDSLKCLSSICGSQPTPFNDLPQPTSESESCHVLRFCRTPSLHDLNYNIVPPPNVVKGYGPT